jgi:hypothetical protein
MKRRAFVTGLAECGRPRLGGAAARFIVLLVSLLGLLTFVVDAAYGAGDVNRTTCAGYPGTEESPGFRASLPDCRAFELVTPPYKAGQPAFGVAHQPPPLSPDGHRLIGIDFAGFAGTENLENKGFEVGAVYAFQRTASGWATEALEPPAHEAARSEYVTASPDLQTSLWETVNQSAPNEEVHEAFIKGFAFALRVPTGQLVTIGRKEPVGAASEDEAFYKGASADLSHVLYEDFSSTDDLWPGDKTEEGYFSLYEYVGTGQAEPRLVGVRNQGPLSGGTINEHAELISQCGTGLGSPGEGSTRNAVSSSGDRVYFSARECPKGSLGVGPEVTELYARSDGSETVSISEPASGQCAECSTPATRAEGRRPALFEGASSDGSKAFFLSEQDLLSGAAGTSLYEYDWSRPEGQHVVLVAPEALGVTRIANDGARIYFVSSAALSARPDLSLPEGRQDPVVGEPNMYVFEPATGQVGFVATLAVGDEAVWRQSDSSRTAFASPEDGRYILFASAAQITPDNTGSVTQLFEYDAVAGTLVRVSKGQRSSVYPEGFGDDGNTLNAQEAPKMLRTEQAQAVMTPTGPSIGSSVASTGAVAFTSRDALAPGAVSETENVYEYREGNVYLVSPGGERSPLSAGGGESRLLGIDQSGEDIFFFTGNPLTPQDQDTQADWYDAREGGGFPEPTAAIDCNGEGCRQPFSPPPSVPSSGGSQVAVGGDNLTPPSVAVVKPPRPKPKAKPLTPKQKLVKALKTCRKKPHKKQQASCEKQARHNFGTYGARETRHPGSQAKGGR